MCGIFGISKKINASEDYNNIFLDIKTLVSLSELRGSDTFGVSFKLKDKNILYKLSEKPTKVILKNSFNKFFEKHLKNYLTENLIMIGQTRLVTNGSKFSYQNNQPLQTKNIIGVHNGIFTNLNTYHKEKTINYEGYNVQSDSLDFFENLSELSEKKDFLRLYINYLNNIDGNYSIAFKIKNENKILISSNCGSLYYYYDKNIFCFSSEKNILENFLKKTKLNKNKTFPENILKCLNSTIIFDLDNNDIKNIDHKQISNDLNVNLDSPSKLSVYNNLNDEISRLKNLRKCSNCILPETYPFISFDENGICNYCLNYKTQKYLGEKKLNEFLENFKSKDSAPDCIVGLSGGRDSCYGLHLLKEKYGMNPIAYTYDWGLTTDISRVNAAKICGKLGVEHIIRSADIEQKRKYVRLNLFSWLNRPHLGMLPIIQVGDKGFYDYGRKLSKKFKIKLVVHCTGYQLEQREFFLGFAGINQKLKNNQRMYSYDFFNKFKMLYWYSLQFLLNPSYINSALLDNFNGFLASFIRKDDFLHLYNYEIWNEKEIKNTLINTYGWQDDISYGKNQWRMGDGQTAFNNFVYYTLAGFSEYDNFRSNQIREGLITREEAIKLCEEDNKIKYDTLKNFSEIIGFNLDNVLSKINCLDKLY